jgi:hypothetical protein
MNMYYYRKDFATYLRNKGIEPEIKHGIDVLFGQETLFNGAFT